MEELKDVYQHFLLYYGADIPKMKQHFKKKRQEARAEGLNDQDDDDDADALKHAPRKTGYTLCQKAGLGAFSVFSVLLNCGLLLSSLPENACVVGPFQLAPFANISQNLKNKNLFC